MKKRKQYRRETRKIRRLLKLKAVMRAWLRYLKSATLDTKAQHLKYCVRYSEWCKCEKCAREREKVKDIQPGTGNMLANDTANERLSF